MMKTKMNNKLRFLYELLRTDPKTVPDEIEFWAIWATSFYENIFLKIQDPKLVTAAYKRMLKDPNLSQRGRDALEFFYKIRLDEIDNPNYWSMLENKKENKEKNMKQFVAENLNEFNNAFGPMAASGNVDRSSRPLVDEIGRLEQAIWNSNNKEAIDEWDNVSQDLLYGNLGYPVEDEEDYESPGEQSWSDLTNFELEIAIDTAKKIMRINKINESFDEEDSIDDLPNAELEVAKAEARVISKEERCVQHVNEIRPGEYRIEDWFDSDQTVASFEDGDQIR